MKSVVITASETISAAQLAALTGMYPQKAYYHRRNRGFPESQNGMYQTNKVIAWLRANGWNVRVI